jgi:hypothetical protein
MGQPRSRWTAIRASSRGWPRRRRDGGRPDPVRNGCKMAAAVQLSQNGTVEIALVRARGLEPPRDRSHRDLNPARLPIPPHPRSGALSRKTGVQIGGPRGTRTRNQLIKSQLRCQLRQRPAKNSNYRAGPGGTRSKPSSSGSCWCSCAWSRCKRHAANGSCGVRCHQVSRRTW